MVRLRRSRSVDQHTRVAVLTLVLALLAASPARAQTATGGLRGFVKDDTGAVLVGVTVEAASPVRIGGAAVDVSDAQGLYRGVMGLGQEIPRLRQGDGQVVWETELPSGTTGAPMTYMNKGRQFIVVPVGARDHPAEFVALALPDGRLPSSGGAEHK